MKKTVLFIMVILLTIALSAHERVSGHLIVRHHNNIRGEARENFMYRYATQELSEKTVLSNELNIILYTYNYRNISEVDMLEMVRKDSSVYQVQFDAYLEFRNEPLNPNDPGFLHQWGLKNTGQLGGIVGADISATEAWAAVLGYEKKNQREIVIAIPDIMSSTSIHHGDIDWWRNTSGHCHLHGLECPNTQLCDYWGWNANSNLPMNQAPSLSSSHHGVAVSGVAAANVNNGTAVAGVAGLGAKIMPIHMSAGGSIIISEAINAYNFVLQKRIAYNQSNGEFGAYVVATNASWGIDGWPSDFPVWASMYDLMGEQGILSTGAVPNSNVNIDIVGDMPGAVTSPWFLSVTNTTRMDLKYQGSPPWGAGYGTTYVHLGAPGTDIHSTINSNGFGLAGSGTSYAAPAVAGVVGLMHIAASEELLAEYDNKPGELASLFRQYLLDGVDVIDDLIQYTSTGGRLNALNPVNSVLLLNELYNLEPPRNLTASLSENSVYLSWLMPETRTIFGFRVYRNNDVIIYNTTNTFYTDNTVSNNTLYNYHVVALYGEDLQPSPKSNTVQIKTMFPPTQLSHTFDGYTVILLWQEPFGSNDVSPFAYNIYRDGSILNLSPISDLTYHDTTSKHDTEYTYSVKAVYDNEESEEISLILVTPFFASPPIGLDASIGNGEVVLTWHLPGIVTAISDRHRSGDLRSPHQRRDAVGTHQRRDAVGTTSLSGFKVYRNGVAITDIIYQTIYIDNSTTNQTD